MLNLFKSAPLALLLSAALPVASSGTTPSSVFPIQVTPASAQERPIELGIDAVSLDVSFFSSFGETTTLTTVSVPVTTFRAGFFVSDQVSVEPRISFDYVKIEDGAALTQVTLSLGVLYHFTPERQSAQLYLRPVGSISFVNVSDQTASQVFLGVGLGVKLPMPGQLASRLELEYAHGFDNDDFANVNSLAAVFGFSFFTQ